MELHSRVNNKMFCHQKIFLPACCHFQSKCQHSSVAHGGHLGNWRPYWNDPKWHVHHQTYFLLAETYHTSQQIIIFCHFNTRCYYMIPDGGHLGNWRPYWNDPNSWIVLIISTVRSTRPKHTMQYQKDLFLPFAAILWQKIGFQNSPWRPSWKMAAILKICMARVIFMQRDPYRVCVPNLLLVS